jgi:ABC-type branched-subunit amino acid transport system permease subunit
MTTPIGAKTALKASDKRTRWGHLAVEAAVLAGLLVAPFVLPLISMSMDVMTRSLIWGLFGLGFSILFGFTGLLSLGQAAFYGAGGFSPASSIKRCWHCWSVPSCRLSSVWLSDCSWSAARAFISR